MRKLTLAALLVFTSLYTYADGFIVLDKTELGILGGGEDYDDELDMAVLDANGDLMKVDIKQQVDESIVIHYIGNPDSEYVIVKIYNKRTNKTTYAKYKKA